MTTAPSEIPESLSGSSNAHSRLAPSGSSTWTVCTASVDYIAANRDKLIPFKVASVLKLAPYLRSIPHEEVFSYEWVAIDVAEAYRRGAFMPSEDQISALWKTAGSVPAREGSRAHEHVAAILLGKKTLEDIPEEFRSPLKTYIEYCQDQEEPGDDIHVEEKVPLFYSENPGDTGTCDYALVSERGVHIIDLKYGKGKLVTSHENTQLAIYALSFVRQYESLYGFGPETPISMSIVMPRHHEAEGAKPWTITLKELEHFCRDIEYAAIQIREKRGLAFCPGEDTCYYCDGCDILCPKRAKWIEASFDMPDTRGFDFLAALPVLDKEEKALPVEQRLEVRVTKATDDGFSDEPRGLTDEQMLAMWKGSKEIKSFLDDLDEYINDRALTGDTFGGEIKLVEGRQGNREWKDVEAADKFLIGQKMREKERYKFVLLGPAAIEKILKDKLASVTKTKNLFESHITRSDGRPVAALASDKRPAITAGIGFLPILEPEEP